MKSQSPGKLEENQTPEENTTNADSETLQTDPTAQSNIVAKAKKIFRRALMLSVIAHTPVICGSFTDQNNKWEQQSFFDSGLDMWDWQKDVKETIKKELNLDEEEAEEVISKIDPQTLEGIEKAKRAIEMRKSDRAKNIDPEKVKNHKDEIRRKLEAGEQILFRDFIFESEEITMGIEPEIVKNAKNIFLEEMEELEKEKPNVPTREFLRRIVSYSEESDAKKGGAYETTQASLSVYLDRKGKGLRGNCEARGKYMVMALEYLYPERWEDVYMQRTADHIRALFKIGETTYMMEPGIRVLTENDRAGTIIYKPQTIIELYAGLESDPIKVEGEVNEKDTKSNLPTMSDTNSEAFPTPKADGKLKMTSRDHSNLYNPNLTPPEVRDMELPKTINGKKREEKKKPDSEDKKPDKKDEESSQTEFMDISQWQIVTDEKGEMTEVLPIKPRDYSDLEISEMVQGNRFYANIRYLETGKRTIFNPTPATIKKINLLALDTVVYGDVTLYGQQALNEAFQTDAGEIIFDLKHPHMPMSLEHAFRSLKSAKEYTGEIQINIDRDLKGRSSVDGDEQGLSPDQFKLLMDGKGGLMLNYKQRKNYDDQEVKAVAKANRPYVMMTGNICEGNAEALRHMNASKGTLLVLEGNRFIRAAFNHTKILENRFVVPTEEFFSERGKTVYPDLAALKNAYMLDYKTQITGISPLAKERLQNYIDLLEKIFTENRHERLGTNADEETKKALAGLREQSLKLFREDMENVSPIGSIGACLIPESLSEAQAMGVKTVTGTNKFGITYTQHWSGEISVKDGIELRPSRDNYQVLLLNEIIYVGWMNHEDVFVKIPLVDGHKVSFPPAEKISVNGRGLPFKDGEEDIYIKVNDNGLIKIHYPDNRFIEFKLKGRPKKIKEVKETGRFYLLLGPKASEMEFTTLNDGTIRIRTEAFGNPSIYTLKPLEIMHIRVPKDMLHLSLSQDSDIIEIKGTQTTGRIVIEDDGSIDVKGTNIATDL